MEKLNPKNGKSLIEPKDEQLVTLPFVRNPYNYDTLSVSDSTALRCPEPTKTQQQFKDDADVNILLERFGAGQQIPLAARQPIWGMDFTHDYDFQRAFRAVEAAREGFDDLPAKIKNRFDNDPGKLLKFLEDESNREEAIFLGIIPKPDTTPAPATIAQAPSPASGSPATPSGDKPAGAASGATVAPKT